MDLITIEEYLEGFQEGDDIRVKGCKKGRWFIGRFAKDKRYMVLNCFYNETTGLKLPLYGLMDMEQILVTKAVVNDCLIERLKG